MKNRILVTYASRAGSTAEVAQVIGKTLSECGELVDIILMNEVQQLSSYRAVIAGSPIRSSKWLPEAMIFIERHRPELQQKPFAMFTLSITLAMSGGSQYRQAVTGWTAPIRAQMKPVSEGMFAGVLDFTKLPVNFDTLKLRLMVALGIFPKEDRRDWNAIHEWARSIQPLLKS
ncbi:MAG: flavodoxin domain-containing protein [Anaerolineales bacterium]